MSIIISEVSKKFGSFQALKSINLEIPQGSLVALLGPSGSGKSTLLRAIAGLEPPCQGKILINGKDTTHLDIRKRNIGFVFQHYALFKEMTVRENIAFGLEIRKYPVNKIKHRVEELLNLIQLQGFGDRYPNQLSGGQRQRVALARALAVNPQVLLLDEPFGALDAKIRKDLRAWLCKLHEEVKVTTVFVTHDQEEAMEVASQIVVMNEGKVEQVGTATEIYDRPANAFVMRFIGEVNTFPHDSNLAIKSGLKFTGKDIFVRPHDIEIMVEPVNSAVAAQVKRVIHLGENIQAELLAEDGLAINAQLTRNNFSQLELEPGQQVFVRPKQTILFQ